MKPYQCRNRLFWHFCLHALSKENSGEIKSDISCAAWFQRNRSFSKRLFLKNPSSWFVRQSPVPLGLQMSLCFRPLRTAAALPVWGSLPAELTTTWLCVSHPCLYLQATTGTRVQKAHVSGEQHPTANPRFFESGTQRKRQFWSLRKAWRLFYHCHGWEL